MTSEEKLQARRERARVKARQQSEDRALALIRAQGRLEKTNTPDAASGSYFSLPSGRVMSRDVCERLIGGGASKALSRRPVRRQPDLRGDGMMALALYWFHRAFIFPRRRML